MSARASSRVPLLIARRLLALLALGLPLATAAQPAVPEYELKLAMLFNIAKFVAWPDARAQRETFTFCVVGGDPFGDATGALERRQLRGRPIVVRYPEAEADAVSGCDLAFIGSAAGADRLRALVGDLRSEPVLTVSDVPEFTSAGGVMALSTRNNRVSIEINTDAQQRAQLSVNAQLLRMATLVNDGVGR